MRVIAENHKRTEDNRGYRRVMVNGHPAAAILQMHTPHSDVLVWVVEYSEPPEALCIIGEAWQRVMGIVPESAILWTDDCIDAQTVAFGDEALRQLHLKFPADSVRRTDDAAYREAAQRVFAQIGAHRVIGCLQETTS